MALYDSASAEALVLTDGICVKAQKPTRQRAGQAIPHKTQKRHDTDIMLLPCRAGGFAFLSEGISGSWSLVEAARTFFCRE
jgi:hypothetical protein